MNQVVRSSARSFGARPGPVATGGRESRDGLEWVVYTRRLRCSVTAAWAALTDPALMARWVGSYRRTDRPGPAEYRFTFEGDNLLPMTIRLEQVEPERHLTISMSDAGVSTQWLIEMSLTPDGDRATEVEVRQSIPVAALAPSIAAGCEFYLDRLVALVERGDVSEYDYDDYFLSQAAHYRRLFPLQQRRLG